MSLTLTHPTANTGGTPLVLALPDDLLWANEFDWHPVTQSTNYTLTGALVVEAATKQAGRPIALEGDESHAWVSRADLVTLKSWASQAGQTLTLSGLRGVSRSVVFDHQAGAIDAAPVVDFNDPDDGGPMYYEIKLRFLEL